MKRLLPGAMYSHTRQELHGTPSQAVAVASALPVAASALLALTVWIVTDGDRSLGWARRSTTTLFVLCFAVHFVSGFVGSATHVLRHREGSPAFVDAPLAYQFLAIRYLFFGR